MRPIILVILQPQILLCELLKLHPEAGLLLLANFLQVLPALLLDELLDFRLVGGLSRK